MDLVSILASGGGKPSHVPFYIAGGVFAAWAVIVAAVGISKSDFPKKGGQMNAVIGITVLLFVVTVGTAIGTSSKPDEELTAKEGPTPTGVPLPPPQAATPTGPVGAAGGGQAGGGAGGGAPAGDPAGRQVFAANCASCHTLAAAQASGAVGPNLDQLKPADAIVVATVTAGKGAMPAFKGRLTPAQVKAVGAYVAEVAGK